ncbi:MAG: hypothetical protein ACR2O4_14340 [Hyphomicrobiaceae bacterium]
MRKHCIPLMMLAALLATPAIAQDKKSQAKSWNLTGQVKARFEAKVVDMLCEVSGGAMCAENCGGGELQLGVVRASDNRLFPVSKNTQPIFSGAVADLLPYCNKDVEVDGLLAGEGDIKTYQVQLIREKGQQKWSKTRGFVKAWKKQFPEAGKKKGAWFRNDPRVQKHIEKDGWLGLGKDTDVAYAKDEVE